MFTSSCQLMGRKGVQLPEPLWQRLCGFGKHAYKTAYEVVEKEGKLERVAMKKVRFVF